MNVCLCVTVLVFLLRLSPLPSPLPPLPPPPPPLPPHLNSINFNEQVSEFLQFDDIFGNPRDLIIRHIQPDERFDAHQTIDIADIASSELEILQALLPGQIGDVEEVVVGRHVDLDESAGHVPNSRRDQDEVGVDDLQGLHRRSRFDERLDLLQRPSPVREVLEQLVVEVGRGVVED